jgi:hypothetical protein
MDGFRCSFVSVVLTRKVDRPCGPDGCSAAREGPTVPPPAVDRRARPPRTWRRSHRRRQAGPSSPRGRRPPTPWPPWATRGRQLAQRHSLVIGLEEREAVGARPHHHGPSLGIHADIRAVAVDQSRADLDLSSHRHAGRVDLPGQHLRIPAREAVAGGQQAHPDDNVTAVEIRRSRRARAGEEAAAHPVPMGRAPALPDDQEGAGRHAGALRASSALAVPREER